MSRAAAQEVQRLILEVKRNRAAYNIRLALMTLLIATLSIALWFCADDLKEARADAMDCRQEEYKRLMPHMDDAGEPIIFYGDNQDI